MKNAAGRGLHVANGAIVKARRSNFSGAGEAGCRNGNGQVEIRQANLTNCGKGLMLSTAVTDAEGADVSGCNIGIEDFGNALVRFENGIANNCVTNGIIGYGSAQIAARDCTINDCGGNAVELREKASANLTSSEILRAGINGLFVSGSDACVVLTDFTGAAQAAIRAYSGRVYAQSTILRNAGTYGAYAEHGSFIDADGSDATGAGTLGYQTATGGFINAVGMLGGGTPQPNVLTRAGVVITSSDDPLDVRNDRLSPRADNVQNLGQSDKRWNTAFVREIRGGDGTPRIVWGTGSPEGAITGPVASIFMRLDGGATTTLYVKTSGTGNTGWTAK